MAFSRAYSDKADIREGAKASDIDDLRRTKDRAEEAQQNLAKMIAFSKSMDRLIAESTDDISDIDDWIEAFKTSKPSL